MNLPVETAKKMQKRHSGTSIFGQKSVRVKHRNNFFFRLFDLIFRSVLYTSAHYTRQSTVAHLSRRLIVELIVYEGIRRPSVCQHFQTTFPLKP